MRTVILLLLVLLPMAELQAEAPGPADAQPADRVPAPGVTAPRTPQPPAGAQAKRNWLLARFIVDQDFDHQKVRSIEEGLSGMSPDQLDVLVQVYQERLRQREASEQSQLDQARANLEPAKAYRDVLAQDLENLRAFRQSQYLSFGNGYGRFGGGVGVGGLGFGGFGYGRPGFVGPGFGGFGFGTGLGLPFFRYGLGVPGVGFPAWGGFMPGMGAGF